LVKIFSRKNKLALALSLIFLLMTFWGSGAYAKFKLYDTHKRHYKVRSLTKEENRDESGGSQLFRFVEYSVQADDGVFDGKKYFMVSNHSKTEEGDVAKRKFYVDPETDKLVRTEYEFISRENKVLKKETEYYGNHFYEYPDKSFTMDLFPFVAQYMYLTPGSVMTFNVLSSPEIRPWALTLVVEGEETVTVLPGHLSVYTSGSSIPRRTSPVFSRFSLTF
jgi:hypothetical protein